LFVVLCVIFVLCHACCVSRVGGCVRCGVSCQLRVCLCAISLKFEVLFFLIYANFAPIP